MLRASLSALCSPQLVTCAAHLRLVQRCAETGWMHCLKQVGQGRAAAAGSPPRRRRRLSGTQNSDGAQLWYGSCGVHTFGMLGDV